MNPPAGPSDLPSPAEKPATDLPVHAVESPVNKSEPTLSSVPPGLATSFPPLPPRTVDEYLDQGMPQRRRLLPLVLFLLTCFFTYAAGTYHWEPTAFGFQSDGAHGLRWDWPKTLQQLEQNWREGLLYMGCVMAVLLAHEMGHFLMTVRYRVPASYPIFIPMPLMFMGTMGAVIGMEGFRANRKQMFDIGLAGPLAGLVLTIPLVCIGIKIGNYGVPQQSKFIFGDPLLAQWLTHWLRPDVAAGAEMTLNPIYMAGWVGMFVTGLNMLPISQLDGGHVIYALFLRPSRWIARGFLLASIAFIVITGQVGWTLMIVIITLIGVDHPRTSNDSVPLGWFRTTLGILSLALPVLCFNPFQLLSG
jgi:Zn-dependent protease